MPSIEFITEDLSEQVDDLNLVALTLSFVRPLEPLQRRVEAIVVPQGMLGLRVVYVTNFSFLGTTTLDLDDVEVVSIISIGRSGTIGGNPDDWIDLTTIP